MLEDTSMTTLEETLSINDRIIKWNKERNLLKTPQDFNLTNECRFILEELIEIMTGKESDEAGMYATNIVKSIISGNLDKINTNIMKDKLVDRKLSSEVYPVLPTEKLLDGFADIGVFTSGAKGKLGHNPDLVMNEILKHIESRTGKVNEHGKFIKDKSPEALANIYTPNFTNTQR